jgi:agmatinase
VIPIPSGRPTFLDVPRCTDLGTLDAHIAIVGLPFSVPYDLYRSTIASTAPQAIREQSMRYVPRYRTHYDYDFGGDMFAGRPVKIVDCGDVATVPGRWEENSRNATAAVKAILQRGAVPIVLGGEHSIPIPVLRAYEGRGPLCLVQVDAHIDWRDEIDGVTEGLSSPMRRAAEMPWVQGMAQIGIRGFGSARRQEFDDASRYGAVIVGAEELHRVGVEEVLRRMPAAERYYITFDADGLDPSIAPGVNSRSFGGVTYYEATNLLKGVAAKGKVVGMDFVEVVPGPDLDGMTSQLAARLIMNLIAAMAHTGQVG